MAENRDIRAKARDTLEHKLFGNVWITLIVLSFLYSVIVGLPGSIGSALSQKSVAMMASFGVILSGLSILLAGPMEYGMCRVMRNVATGKKKAEFYDLFVAYKEAVTESVVLGLLRTIFICLWSLLFLIPGIVKAYAYSMAFYIQQDAEDKDWRRCLDESQEMMHGNKGKLFLLDLSFIGWYIVGALCFGIGILWVSVYHMTARAHFYNELKKAQGEDDSADAPAEEGENGETDTAELFGIGEQAEPKAETPADGEERPSDEE